MHIHIKTHADINIGETRDLYNTSIQFTWATEC